MPVVVQNVGILKVGWKGKEKNNHNIIITISKRYHWKESNSIQHIESVSTISAYKNENWALHALVDLWIVIENTRAGKTRWTFQTKIFLNKGRRNLHRKELVIKVDTQVSNIYKDLIEIRMEFTNNQGYVYINKSTELVVKDENKKILYRLSAPV